MYLRFGMFAYVGMSPTTDSAKSWMSPKNMHFWKSKGC
jgi:hypothetical protein